MAENIETAGAAASPKLHHNVVGALWMLASAVTFTLMMSLVKYLGDYPAPVQMFYRQLASLVVLTPVILKMRGAAFKTDKPGLIFMRAAAATIALTLSFYGYQNLPLADANALSFTRALWVTPLAFFLLRETVGLTRVAATVVGFLGVLFMVQEGGKGGHFAFGWPTFAMLASSFLFAWTVTGMKVLTRTHSPTILMVWSAVLGVIFAIPLAIPTWTVPTPRDLLLLLGLGAIAVANQACFMRGVAIGDASAMAPMDYTRLVFAVIFGLMFFNEVPSAWTMIGAGVVIASTLFITWWDQRKAARKAA